MITNSIDATQSDDVEVSILANSAALATGFTAPTVAGGDVQKILPLGNGTALVVGNFSSISDGDNIRRA